MLDVNNSELFQKSRETGRVPNAEDLTLDDNSPDQGIIMRESA